MRKIKINLQAFFFVLTAILTLSFSGVALAEMQSTNFQIKSDVVGSFGADSTSAGFQLNDTGGEVGGKLVSGSDKDLWGGFWNNIFGGQPVSDEDGDGVADGNDNCPSDSNSNQNDSDDDGVGDACDNCENDSNSNQNDSDNDDVGNACDNCPDDSNANQNDSDNDGVGDSCDNCATVSNPDQQDSNNNGVGDACEPAPINDADGDGIRDSADNCPMTFNPNQEDMDNDGTGDVCDADMDGDGIINTLDNCPLVSNLDQKDSDNDGQGDVCDPTPGKPNTYIGPPIIVPDDNNAPISQKIISVIGSATDSIDKVAKKVEQKAVEQENTINTVSAVVAVAAIIPVVASAGSLAEVGLILTNSFGSLFGLIFRRRKDWGIVYDVDTGEPVFLASIEIVNSLGKILDKKITDKNGAYIFLVPKGKYSLNVEKEGYALASEEIDFKTTYSDNYYGGELDIENPDAISFNIPVRSTINRGKKENQQGPLLQKSLLYRAFFSFTAFVFYAGFLMNIWLLFVLPNKEMAIAIMLAYILGALVRDFGLREKGWGTVIGLAGEVSPFATVRAFEKESGAFVARTISDEMGRYALILRRGEYNLSVMGVQGERWDGEVNVFRTKVIKKRIKLEDSPSPFAPNVGGNRPAFS